MITYEWHTSIPVEHAGEVDKLVAEAAGFDSEAGFSTVDVAATGDSEVTHLLVTMPPRGERGHAELDALPEGEVVAYLQLEQTDELDPADGHAVLRLVVRKEFRSLGLATLLFERLCDEDTGWASRVGLTQVSWWAHGPHPAAQRLAARFGAELRRELVKQVRPVPPQPALNAPPAARSSEVDDADMATDRTHRLGAPRADAELLGAPACRLRRADGGAVVVRDQGRAALLQLERASDAPEEIDDLLLIGLARAQQRGARAAFLYVDPATDPLLLHLSRELGFFHDQSDLRYSLALNNA